MIEMTPVAAEKLRELRGTDPSRAFLRMYVAGKSCCSTQFGLAFDASPDDKDTVSDVAGIPLAVDPLSQPYADGAIIDFVDGPDGTGFLVKNPTLSGGGGCSCGRGGSGH
jgi:iron-sulfur cluster insertion protein